MGAFAYLAGGAAVTYLVTAAITALFAWLALLHELFVVAAIILWGLVIAVYWLGSRRAAPGSALWNWLMSNLDRLTNRQALQARFQQAAGVTHSAFDPAAFRAHLERHVIGNRTVIDTMVRQLDRGFAREKRSRPIGVFMLVGPPAGGKTNFARHVGEALYGENGAVHIDMTALSAEHAKSSLFGAAKGYSGSDKYGLIPDKLRANPKQVFVLDEVEKADREAQRAFLDAFERGKVTEASDQSQWPADQAVFIMTSNAQDRELVAAAARYPDDDAGFAQECRRMLQGSFEPAFLSRVDHFFVILPLKGEELAELVAIQIEKAVLEFGLELAPGGIDVDVLLDITRQMESSGHDARQLRRAIDDDIGDQVLARKREGVSIVRIDSRDGHAVVVPA